MTVIFQSKSRFATEARALSPALRSLVERSLSWRESSSLSRKPLEPTTETFFQAQALLVRWKRLLQLKSGSEEAFATRLAHLGWSEERALLQMTAPMLHDEFVLPEWANVLKNALEFAEEMSGGACLESLEAVAICTRAMESWRAEDLEFQWERPVFLAFVLPFAALALRELRGNPLFTMCLSTPAQEDLARSLVQRLSSLCARTVAHEMKRARLRGELWGATPQERYRYFIDRSLPSRRTPLLQTYPVLARMLGTVTDQFRLCTTDFLSRLHADWKCLRELTRGGTLPVRQLTPFLSDVHEGGQSVWRILLNDEPDSPPVFYKPRSLAIDDAWSSLIHWLNETGMKPYLKAAESLDMGAYGWSLGVTAGDCADEGDVALYFRRQGCLSALITMLGGQDFHAENFVANGSMPVAIDLEGLLAATISTPTDPLDRLPLAAQAIQFTGSGSLMLPYFRSGAQDQTLFVASGIAGTGSRSWPSVSPRWAGQETDELHLEFVQQDYMFDDSVPKLRGIKTEALRYKHEVQAGITDTFKFLEMHRVALLDKGGPLERFKGVEARSLFRDTQEYVDLLFWTTSPDVLACGAAYDVALEVLAGAPSVFCNGARFKEVADLEKNALWCRDVPIGRTANTSVDLCFQNGVRLGPIISETSWDQLRLRIQGWDVQKTAWQGGAATALLSLVEKRSVPPADDLPAAATSIGEALMEVALRFDQEVSWLNLIRGHGSSRVYPLQADAWDLNGNAGVGLFFAELARVTGRQDFQEMAVLALSSAQRTLNAVALTGFRSSISLSGFSGSYALVYALTRAGVALKMPALIDAALEAALTHSDDVLRAEKNPDFLTGLAGSLAVIAELHRHRPHARLLQQAELCSGGISNAAAEGSCGADGWQVPLFSRPLLGMAHGSSGIATGLLQAATLLPRSTLDVVGEAFDHERRHFDTAKMRWPNLQRRDDHWMHGWCAGQAGIGYARLTALSVAQEDPRLDKVAVDVDLRNALSAVLDDVDRGGQHACCGDAGSLMFLARASRVLDRPELLKTAQETARTMLRNAAKRGAWQMQDFTEHMALPGLMSGITGIGFALLSLSDPCCSEFLTLC